MTSKVGAATDGSRGGLRQIVVDIYTTALLHTSVREYDPQHINAATYSSSSTSRPQGSQS